MIDTIKNMPIGRKLLAAFTLCLLLFTVISGAVSFWLVETEVRRRAIEDELPVLVAGIKSDVQRQLAPAITASLALADNTFMVEWDRGGMPETGRAAWLAYATALKKRHTAAAVFWGSERDHKYYTDDGVVRDILSTETWFPEALNQTVPYSLNIDFDLKAQKHMVFINARVDGPIGQRAVAGVGLSADAIADTIARYQIAETGSVYLVRANGTVLMHRNKELITGKQHLKDMPGLNAEMASQLLRGEKLNKLHYHNGQSEQMLVSTLIPELNAYVVAEVPVEELTGPVVRALRISGLVALLLGGGVALVGISLISRAMLAPLHRAVNLLTKIAHGDLTHRMPTDTRDEIGQLGMAINRLVESLISLVQNMRQSAAAMQANADGIAADSVNLSQRTEDQAGNLQRTAASMEQLTVAVRHNTDTAKAAVQLAGGATQAAQEGGGVVAQVTQTMGQINASSSRIADITGVIDGIAFQTNILALNAAVEAARAGEQGRGFAVVASEVRMLAQRSAQAAREIKELIQASVNTVALGSEQAVHAREAMDNIVQQVAQMHQLMQEISLASTEQSTGLEQIGLAVSQLDAVTQQNTTLVDDSASVAQNLQQQSAHLAQLLAGFRI